MAKRLRVLVWTDAAGAPAPGRKLAYPEGIHECIAGFLNESEDIEAVAAAAEETPLRPDALAAYDALVLWGHGRPISPDIQRGIVACVERGELGVVGLHSILIFHVNPLLVGSLFGQTRRYMWEDGVRMRFTPTRPHPIFEGVGAFELKDEAYYEPLGLVEGFQTLLVMQTLDEERTPQAYHPEKNRYEIERVSTANLATRAAWTYRVGLGRSFYFQPGHETDATYRRPVVQRILTQAVRWAARREARGAA